MARPQSILGRVLGSKWTLRLVTLLVFGAIWQWYALEVDSLLIPTFTGTMEALVELLTNLDIARSNSVYDAFLISNEALLFGFALALALGIPIGLLMARFPRAERFFDPYINILLVTPMAALIPILLMSLGIGMESRILLVVLFAIPMLIVNSRAGVRQVDPALIEMATSFGAREREIWKRILLPGSLPAIMTGVRLGVGRAVTAMVIVELLMVSVGIGGLILEFRGTFRPELLYATVILVVLEALLLISIVRWLEGRIAPWATHATLSE
jgi:NitT/TauT family transport system permease protein